VRIEDIEFDERLLKAQHDGSLVLFAGAGVSMGPPSNYPSFDGLTRGIARKTGLEWPEKEPSERFLGRLVSKKAIVHKKVAEILSSPESKPKKLHEDLLRLFGSLNQVRIVTTNFDAHFETAAKDVYGQPPELFSAPALPLGNDFLGLVYLHGSVLGDPKRLVLTDQDFGRAYLTEGWATRFLQSMFSEYTVLFVGYSHKDTVMHYLSRGLPSENTKPRFALVREDDNLEEWRYRGIEPLGYPFEGEGDYSKLTVSVAGWVDWAHRGALGTEQRIKELVEGLPPLDSESQDFLLWAISDSVALRFFVRYAKEPEWLIWVSDHNLLEPLFSQEKLSEQHKELARWVAETYAAQHPEVVFAVLGRYRKALHPWFVDEIIREFAYGKAVPNKDTISRWIPILLQNNALGNPSEYSELLGRAIRQGAISAAAQLFTYLTKPRLLLEKALMWPEEEAENKVRVDARLEFLGDYHLLNDVWEKMLRPRLSEMAFCLWPNVAQNLNQAYQLSHSWGKAGRRWDPLSWHRSAIEPHEQDKYPHMEDVLINAARDCLEWALENVPLVGQAWIETLSAMEPMLARRLAVHGISFAKHLAPNGKIRWLLEKDLLMDSGLKHEVFRLLKKAYPGADSELRKELLDAAISRIDAFPEEDKARKEYEKYNLLHWLSSADPSCEEVTNRFAQINKRYPHFRPREYPDLGHWTSGGTWSGPRSPVPAEELLEKRPAEWMEYFLSFKGNDFKGPDRDGLLQIIGEAVARDFDWGRELTELLIDRADPMLDLWKCVIRGWYGTGVSEEQWDYVLSTLDEEEGLAQHHSDYISDLLQRGAEKEKEGVPVRLLDKADRVAQRVWATLEDKKSDEPNDWLGRAINRPGGKLTLFWLNALSRVRKQSGKKEEGLIQPYRERFDTIVTAKNEAGTLGRVILASQLGYLHAVDAAWSRTNIIPLLDWSKATKQARQAWDGWLSWGRLGDPLLQELIPHYRKAFSYLSSELREERHRFVEHVVAISLFWMNNPMEEGWLFDFLQRVEDEDRVAFASQVCSHLMGMKEETKRGLWKRWLKSYWESRNQGAPVPLSNGELKEMVEWAGELEPVFPEVVEIICGGPVPKIDHTSLFYRMKKAESQISALYPEAMTRLLIHLTSNTEIPRYFCTDLEELTEQAISVGASAHLLNQLCDQLAAIGCPNASKLSEKLRA